MERKTKYRILGVIVLIAVGIIFLPLFQSNKETPQDVVVVKAPPFPDQAQTTQVALNEPTSINTADMNNEASNKEMDFNQEPSINTQNTPPAPDADESVKAVSATPNSIENNAEDLTKNPTVASNDIAKDEPANIQSEDMELPVTPAVKQEAAKPQDESIHSAKITQNTTKKIKSNTKHVASTTIKKIPTPYLIKSLPAEDNGLTKLKNPAWVIQVGSFKNKTNALRLVNQLRANGYPTFIQQTSTMLGNNTRVFVGPANKQNTARMLASKLESELHIHGFVMSYKPLDL